MKARLNTWISPLFLAAGVFLGACSSQPSQPAAQQTTAPPAQTGSASVRVIDAIPGNKNIDVLAGDQVAFPNVEYKAVTDYKELPDARFNFQVVPSGQNPGNQPLAKNSEGLSNGGHYTLVAFDDKSGETQLKSFDDDLKPPSAGKAKVRIIHAAPEAPDVDVYAPGRTELFSGVDSGSNSDYKEIDPMKGTLQIRPDGKQTSLLNIPNVDFEAGKAYTIVLVGRTTGTPKLEAVRVEDPISTDSQNAEVR